MRGPRAKCRERARFSSSHSASARRAAAPAPARKPPAAGAAAVPSAARRRGGMAAPGGRLQAAPLERVVNAFAAVSRGGGLVGAGWRQGACGWQHATRQCRGGRQRRRWWRRCGGPRSRRCSRWARRQTGARRAARSTGVLSRKLRARWLLWHACSACGGGAGGGAGRSCGSWRASCGRCVRAAAAGRGSRVCARRRRGGPRARAGGHAELR